MQVSLLGGFMIEAANGAVALPSRKAQAILAYLLLAPSRSETRERIAGLLWSGAPEEQARASLRQALRRLNQFFDAAGQDGIDVTRSEIRLIPDVFATDLWTILDRDADAPVHPTLLQRNDITASLLVGFEDLDPAFGSWILVQRQTLHDRLVASLEARITDRTRPGGPDAERISKDAALALSNLDPTHEAACRELMLQHVRSGDVASALKRYNRLWELLENEYDMEPSDETKALVAQIKSGPAERDKNNRTDDAAATNPSGAPRLVIGSFSGDGVPEPLRFKVRAFRHQLMSSVLKFREWLVIDGEREERTKTFASLVPTYYLEADAYLKGTVMYVLLSVRETATDNVLWSEESPANLETWPRTLKLLVQKLAVAINVHLSVGRSGRPADDTKVSPSIHDRWLHGRSLMRQWTPTAWTESAEIFEAIAADATHFAPAFSSLSLCASLKRFVFAGCGEDPSLSGQALDAAKSAVESGPRDTKSYHASAWAHLEAGEFERAILCFGIAENLNENDVGIAVSVALGLAYCGETEEALRRIETLQESNASYRPLHWAFEAACRYMCRDYPGAIWAAAKAGETHIIYIQAWTAAAFAQLGDDKAARRAAKHFLRIARENWTGAVSPLPVDIARWFLSAQPFRNPEDYFHLKHGMERAGLNTD